MEKENAKKLIIKGIAKYPKFDKEEGKFSMKVCVSDKELERIENEIDDLDGELSIREEEELNGINVKTSFECVVYDRDGNELTNSEYEIYEGAKILATVVFKEYVFKRKKGVTAYLLGACVLEQGTPYNSSVTFDDFQGYIDNEDLQF